MSASYGAPRARAPASPLFLPLFTPALALYFRPGPPRFASVPAPIPSSPPRPPVRGLRTARHDRAYRPRFLAALAVSLLALTLTFQLWPTEKRADQRRYVATPQEQIALELIEPTAQARRAAPPPPPTLPPIEVPDDVPIPDEEIVFDDLDLSPTLEPIQLDAPPGLEEVEGDEGPVFVERADRRPRTVTPVFPDYPRAAEQRDIRARVRIRVLVDERGRVQETLILERFLLDDKDREERVAEIGYGVEEAALDAARRTPFRPGRHGGRAVQTYTTLTLGVGV